VNGLQNCGPKTQPASLRDLLLNRCGSSLIVLRYTLMFYKRSLMLKHLRCFFLLVVAALGILGVRARAQDRGPSTPEERARAVQVSRALRADPTASSVLQDRQWMMVWLIQVPDISVKMCPSLYGDLGDSKSESAGALVATMMASEAAFVIENPKKAKDDKSVYYAGLDGLLDGYQAIQKKNPDYKLPQLEELLKKRTDGKLEEYVREAAKKCKK